jgi:hypothetical protein
MVLAVQNSTVCGIVDKAQQGAAAIINPNWTTTASQRHHEENGTISVTKKQLDLYRPGQHRQLV